jgi:hypothetical protein
MFPDFIVRIIIEFGNMRPEVKAFNDNELLVLADLLL